MINDRYLHCCKCWPMYHEATFAMRFPWDLSAHHDTDAMESHRFGLPIALALASEAPKPLSTGP